VLWRYFSQSAQFPELIFSDEDQYAHYAHEQRNRGDDPRERVSQSKNEQRQAEDASTDESQSNKRHHRIEFIVVFFPDDEHFTGNYIRQQPQVPLTGDFTQNHFGYERNGDISTVTREKNK
jgi:hypothetical protein